jgi:hypothetical protein
MLFRRLFARFLAPATPPPVFTADLGGDDTEHLRAEMQTCLNRTGGTLATARRAEALSDLFWKLTPEGCRAYIATLESLDTTAAEVTSERYSQIEEAELFGRSSSKLAILDSFESPQRRMLSMLKGTRNGSATIEKLRSLADEDLKSSIDTL